MLGRLARNVKESRDSPSACSRHVLQRLQKTHGLFSEQLELDGIAPASRWVECQAVPQSLIRPHRLHSELISKMINWHCATSPTLEMGARIARIASWRAVSFIIIDTVSLLRLSVLTLPHVGEFLWSRGPSLVVLRRLKVPPTRPSAPADRSRRTIADASRRACGRSSLSLCNIAPLSSARLWKTRWYKPAISQRSINRLLDLALVAVQAVDAVDRHAASRFWSSRTVSLQPSRAESLTSSSTT
jgi:hypothetical protein